MPQRALAPVTAAEIDGPEQPVKAYGRRGRARAQLAQVQEQAPSPESPTLVKAFIERTREHLKAYREAAGLTQGAVATAIGVSGPLISQFEADKYTGSNPRLARKLAGWLALEGRRAHAPRQPEWVQTKNSTEILTVLEQCLELGDFGMIYGAAGACKTRTAEVFAAEHHPLAIYLVACRTMRSPGAFLRRLAGHKDIRTPSSGTMDAVFEELRIRLEGSGRLLIVDDAQALEFDTVDVLRQLRDMTGIGLALVGDEILWQRLAEGRTQAEWARIRSRIGIRRCLQPGFPPADVEAVARQYIDGADRECLKYLEAKASGVGGLRSVVSHCRMAFRLAAKRRDESAVTLEDIEKAGAVLRLEG